MSCSLTLSAEISNVKFMGSPMCLQADKEFQKGQKTPKIAQEKAQHVLTVNVFNDIVKFSQKKKKKDYCPLVGGLKVLGEKSLWPQIKEFFAFAAPRRPGIYHPTSLDWHDYKCTIM